MKKFKGFNPKQQLALLQKLGYSGSTQSDEMEAFIQSSPGVSAQMGKYHEMAQSRLNPSVGMATGGFTNSFFGQQLLGGNNQNQDTQDQPTTPSSPVTDLASAESNYAQAQLAYANNQIKPNKDLLTQAQTSLQAAQSANSILSGTSAAQLTQTGVKDPSSLVVSPDVATTPVTSDQLITAGTGQVDPTAPATVDTVGSPVTATSSTPTDAAVYDPSLISTQVQSELDSIQAAQGTPTTQATVRGQLESLMEDFEGGGTPPWASGAMRKAMGVMQARGMGASSLAGAAVVQAAMESAIGIASQDASTFAAFEMKNLDNRQQTLILKTQFRIQSLMSDQAQVNAASQFNAASENQTNQFFAGLETSVSQFNASQINAIRQFNAGETNAMSKFNEQIKSQRDMFNAQNSLIISQANTKWRQDVAIAGTQSQNTANMFTASQVNGLTTKSMDQIWQTERDLMNFAFASSESKKDRNLTLLLKNKQVKGEKSEALGFLTRRLLFGL
ncbi:MAG: hypothetical protein COA78_20330 [Blastopirellula sp.]|nr:MAG: hypothetical protein COA78_20330 [Blastopirellula sp.]